MKVAYCGIAGAYAEEAARAFFPQAQMVGMESFAEAFRAVQLGTAERCVVPVENSITGAVIQNIDLLMRYELCVVGEQLLAIRHELLALPGAQLADIQEVYSHEQAFSQCADFLSAHRDWLCVPYFNTAIAARYVRDTGDPGKAVIASPHAREIYGLTCLVENISSERGNITRFFVLAAQPVCVSGANKATLVFTLAHECGTLKRALDIFYENNVNMCRIESRPIHGRQFEYRFFVDVEADESSIRRVAQQLTAVCTQCTLLGMYERARAI